MESTTVNLGQPPESFRLEQLDGALKLRKVLFQTSVRKLGHRLTSERFDDRSELAHKRTPSNMCSMGCRPRLAKDVTVLTFRTGKLRRADTTLRLPGRSSRRSHFRGAESWFFVPRFRLIRAGRRIGRTTHG